MSVYKNRMVRFMYKDIYLPIHCYASKKQFYSLVGECVCMTKCKFSRVSKCIIPLPKTIKDYTNIKTYR